MFRGFIAVEVEANSMVEAFANALKDTGATLKLVEPENIHMTLKFLGNVIDDHVPKINEIMIEAVKGMEPFTIELRDTGAFPNMNYIKVIWIGMRGAERLSEIASYLDSELEPVGYKRDKRGFSPHITIARVKSARNVGAVRKLLSEYKGHVFGEQLVDNIRLKKSELRPQGPLYSVVEEAKFGH